MKTHDNPHKHDRLLPTVEVGGTGIHVTQYALGGFHQVEISSEHVAEVVTAYLEVGGNYIETARSYGKGASEEKLGRALEGRRDLVVLCSKTAAATADEAWRELEATLRALRTDRIEFYLYHGITTEKLATITGPGGAAEAFARAKDEGVIRGIGCSSHEPEAYLDAIGRLDLALILVWCNYLDNLNFPIIPQRVIPEARRRGITVTGMKPLADGFLHRSAAEAVRYCLGAGAQVAVCGTNRVEHVRQVADAVRQGPMEPADRVRLLDEAVELGQYVCRQCGRCGDELMDTYRLEGEFDRQMIDGFAHGPAEDALRVRLAGWFGRGERARKEFAATGRTAAALEAAAAKAECPFGIDLPRKTRLAVAKLTEQPVAML
jgi:diketogulonate reductase-like aldo/keto reductase